MTPAPAAPPRRVYGRRRGKKLRPGRRALLDDFLPRLRVAVPAAGRLDPRSLFRGAVAAVWLEVGFGAGEHLAAQARAHPDVGMIGCEPFVNGVAALLSRIADEGLTNVRVLDDDARPLLDALADASIGRMFVLFPDPWPKTRHHKRRFVNAETLAACARILGDGAELRLATDDPEYGRWMLEHARREPGLEWLARRPADWRTRPDDWPATRYERKARRLGRAPMFLRFRRRPRAAA